MIPRQFAVAFAACVSAVPMFAASCESLASLNLPDTTITSAESIAAGAFTLPAGRGGRGGGNADAYRNLPAFCRVSTKNI